MAGKEPFSLVYAPAVHDHLATIERKYHSFIRDKLEEQLAFEPGQATRNRKPLKQPAAFGATWELRLGPGNRFRVLYAIDAGRATCTSWRLESKSETGWSWAARRLTYEEGFGHKSPG